MVKKSYIYITTNFTNSVFYTGVTNDLVRRIFEHKNSKQPGFVSRYYVNKLVYFEEFEDITDAISREKQIKAGSRKRKIDLIKSHNPNFNDLYSDIIK